MPEPQHDGESVELIVTISDTTGEPTIKALGPPNAVEAVRRIIAERSELRLLLKGLFVAEDTYQAHVVTCKDDPCETCGRLLLALDNASDAARAGVG